jgi:hypothetical protein
MLTQKRKYEYGRSYLLLSSKCWRRLSVYLPDRNADPKVRKLEDSFIAYDLGKNYEGYETHLVVWK